MLLAEYSDRVSRGNSLGTFGLYDRWYRLGLRKIVTREKTFDLDNRTDLTLLGVTQDHGSHPFLLRLAERVANGMAAAAKAGYWTSKPPAGYRLDHGPREGRRKNAKLVLHEEHAPIVREAFERYADGASTTQLARWLSGKLPRQSAAGWYPQAVQAVLRNRVYTGVVEFGKRGAGNTSATVVRTARQSPRPASPPCPPSSSAPTPPSSARALPPGAGPPRRRPAAQPAPRPAGCPSGRPRPLRALRRPPALRHRHEGRQGAAAAGLRPAPPVW